MYDRILSLVRQSTWLITRDMLETITGILDRRVDGIHLDAQSLDTLVANGRKQREVVSQSAVGVLPVFGPIVHHGGLFDEVSGLTSADALSAGFDMLQGMEDVGTILLHVDSPGGMYNGTPELADKIYRSRGGKPIVAHIDANAGSGAYWIASAADEVIITPSGEAGSIGAYRMHEETSQLDETIGVKRVYIVDDGAEYKTEGNSSEPLSDNALAYHQAEVNRTGDEFRSAVAKYRGVSLAKVRSEWGKGRMLNAQQAVAVGMVDKIASYEATITRFASGRGRAKKRVENARRILSIS